MVYEKGGLPVFKNFIFISQLFVVPSLNVATTNDLGCVLFLFFFTMSRQSFAITCGQGESNVATLQEML